MSINLEYIKAQLEKRRDQRQLAAVARRSGINIRTLQRLMGGQSCSTAMALRAQKFLQETEFQKRLEDAGE